MARQMSGQALAVAGGGWEGVLLKERGDVVGVGGDGGGVRVDQGL